MAKPTLQQAQNAINFLTAWDQAFTSGSGAAPSYDANSNGNLNAIILSLLGYYDGPLDQASVTTQGLMKGGAALNTAIVNMINDYAGKHYDPSQTLTAQGLGVPPQLHYLAMGLQQALAAEAQLQSGGPSHSGGPTTQSGGTTQYAPSGGTYYAPNTGGSQAAPQVTSGGGIAGFLNSTTGKVVAGLGLLGAAVAVATKMKK